MSAVTPVFIGIYIHSLQDLARREKFILHDSARKLKETANLFFCISPNFAAETSNTIINHQCICSYTGKMTNERKTKKLPAEHALDERLELLETIREIVDTEVSRKLGAAQHDAHPENPPPRQSLLKRLRNALSQLL